jgi:hypothetical protein
MAASETEEPSVAVRGDPVHAKEISGDPVHAKEIREHALT